MADLHYLDNNNWGASFADSFNNGSNAARNYAQRIREIEMQRQWHAANIQLEQQKLQQNAPLVQAQIANYLAEGAHRQTQADAAKEQLEAGRDLGAYTQQAGQIVSGPRGQVGGPLFQPTMEGRELFPRPSPMSGTPLYTPEPSGPGPDMQPLTASDPRMAAAVQSAIMGRQAVLAAQYPHNIGEQIPQIQASMDPRVRMLMATKTHALQPVPAGGTLYDSVNEQPMYTAPGNSTGLTYDQRVSLEDIKNRNDVGRRVLSANITPLPAGGSRMKEAEVDRQARKAMGGGTAPVYGQNKQTGHMIVSYDGGDSWQELGQGVPTRGAQIRGQVPGQAMPPYNPIQAPQLRY